MMKFAVHIIALLLCVCHVGAQEDVVLDSRFDANTDIYAMAFRSATSGVEGWLTVASDQRDDGRRKLARVMYRDGMFTEPEVLPDAALNHPESLYDGVPTFHPCDPTTGIIVSDRPAAGSARRSNDLYLVRQQAYGWTAERLPFNSDAWDDTPCFGTDGNVVYFSSDRRRPGSGRADIYMVRRRENGWAEPILLTQICADSLHETSPFVLADTLYFTSNTSGDQDIYRIALDRATGMPTGAATPLTMAGVNVSGANEYHPVMSPGGNWVVFSSDRPVNGISRYRLYYRRLQRSSVPRVDLRVTARTRIRDLAKVRFFGRLDSIYTVATSVKVTDLATGVTSTLTTNADGVITLPNVIGEGRRHPGSDLRWQRFVVEAISPSPTFVSSVDTIIIGATACSSTVEHVLYLQDTTSMDRTCEFTFRTFNVPFFVTTYWCPTTRKYRAYTPCTSLFTDDVPCEQIQQPEHCETNEAYTYTYEPARLTRQRRGAENCVAYAEFDKNGPAWAEEVDRSIEHMRDEVRSALSDACVQAAVAAGMTVDVTYIGTTDDRQIDPDCKYTGMSYDKLRSYAPHIDVDSAVVPFIGTNRSFNRGGYGGRAGGNQLLSDVRSLYFAILFDNLCSETIPTYRMLKQRGQLQVRSRGEAIDRRDLPYELKRAAGVVIRVPDFTQRFAGQAPAANRRVLVCDDAMPCGAPGK